MKRHLLAIGVLLVLGLAYGAAWGAKLPLSKPLANQTLAEESSPPPGCPECELIHVFEMATINVQLFPATVPGSQVHNALRAEALGEDFAASSWDVVLLQEGFSGDNIVTMSGAADCGHRFEKCRFHRPYGEVALPPLNGGLGVLSVYDFDERPPSGIKWSDCYGTTDNANDCLANKGFYHVQLEIPNADDPRYPVTLDVINLHHDAGNCDAGEPGCEQNAETRQKQLQQLSQELDQYPNGTFLLAGDFNIVGPPCIGVACNDVYQYDWIPGELDQPGQRELRDAWAEAGDGTPGYTADSLTNSYRTCADPSNPGSLGCRQERIDYIWVSDVASCYKLQVRDIRVETFPALGRIPAHEKCGNVPCASLSDHYGLVSTIEVWKDNSEPLAPPCSNQKLVEIHNPPGTVAAGSTQSIEVRVPLSAVGVGLLVDGSTDGVSLVETRDGRYTFTWAVPDQAEDETYHTLRASATVSGVIAYDEVSVTATKEPPGEVAISISPRSPQVGQQVTVTVQAPPTTTLVQVEVSNFGTDRLADDDDGKAPWIFVWPSAKSGRNTIRATAFLEGGFIKTGTLDVDVSDASAPRVEFRRLLQRVGGSLVPYPVQGAVMQPGFDIIAEIYFDDDDLESVVLTLTVKKPDGTSLSPKYPDPGSCQVATQTCQFTWPAGEQAAGQYQLIAEASDGALNTTTETITVRLDPSVPAGPLVWLNVAQETPPQTIPNQGFKLRLHAASNGYLRNRFIVTSETQDGSEDFQAQMDQHPSGLEGDYEFDFKPERVGIHTLRAVINRLTGTGWVRMAEAPVITVNVKDVVLPTVKIATPTAGDVVTHRIPVVVQASDNIGLSEIELFANQESIKKVEIAGPSAAVVVPWCPSQVSPGLRLEARARDVEGNETRSAPIEVDVQALGCIDPALVNIVRPAYGEKVGGDVLVETRTDPSVTEVAFFIDGERKATVTSPPFQWSWQASCYADGVHRITATANGVDSESTDVTVANVNHPPMMTGLEPSYSVEVGASLAIGVGALDSDCADTVDIRAAGLPDGAVFQSQPGVGSATAQVLWSPLDNQVGSHTLSFTATDSRGASSPAQSTNVVAFCRANAKLLPPSPLGPYDSGQVVTLGLDKACGALTWSFFKEPVVDYEVLSGCRQGNHTDPLATTCTLRLTDRLPGKVGPDKSVLVQVDSVDLVGGRAVDSVKLEIETIQPPVNHPPVFEPIPAQTVRVRQMLSFEIVANDDDEDLLVLTAAGLPAGAAFDVLESFRGYARGRFTWTPASTGSVSVTFTAQEKEIDEPVPTGLKTSVVVGITVTHPPGPDLTVEKLSWPQTVVIGSTVNLVHTVRNIGTLDAVAANGGFVTQIYVDGQRLTTAGASRNIPNLAAGAGNTSGLQWTPTSCGRSFTVHMKTDDTALVTEVREDNNLTPPHTITVSCTSSPDLVIQTLTVEPSLPASGSIPRFVATVHNAGVASAGASQTRLRLDEGSDGIWDIQAAPLSTGSLSPGATITHVWFDEWVAKPGKHVVEVCADAAGSVVEGVPGGEDNNCQLVSFVVKTGK